MPTLHIIAGSRHEYYLDHQRRRVQVDLTQPGIEVVDFVPDVRPACRRAAVGRFRIRAYSLRPRIA